ncbi:MAG TPA: M23 family metallopeptidase [Gemmatimonadaceae bacterium]|nr:M23 family metallopeptidase [Gemmatimonadaceae bacterium]
MTDPTHSRSQGYGNIYTPHAGSMIIQVQRESGLANRTIIFTQRQVRLLRMALYVGGALLTVGTISWVYLAAQAARVPFLTGRVTILTKEVQQLDTLQARLAEMERRFLQVQTMMGASGPVAAVKEPVVTAPPPPPPRPDTATPTLPSLWPLEVEGYVTRGSADSTDYSGPHPGLDVAVPVGTPIRAAGGGTVVEVGDDAKYGKFVRLEHRDGYETLYAHASQILVKQGEKIPSGRAIALSGNTGQSTAPHLHFEVRQGGAAVDPMLLITKKKE